MEPQLPSPSSPEVGPVHSNEQLAPLRAPERAPVSGGERTEQREQQPAGPSDPAMVQPAPPPLPSITARPIPQSAAPVQPVTNSGNPAVAADEDLIEKEWVEKAKKVIAETKHDPHLQEQAVSRLQADYLQKRYGKTIKLPNDG